MASESTQSSLPSASHGGRTRAAPQDNVERRGRRKLLTSSWRRGSIDQRLTMTCIDTNVYEYTPYTEVQMLQAMPDGTWEHISIIDNDAVLDFWEAAEYPTHVNLVELTYVAVHCSEFKKCRGTAKAYRVLREIPLPEFVSIAESSGWNWKLSFLHVNLRCGHCFWTEPLSVEDSGEER